MTPEELERLAAGLGREAGEGVDSERVATRVLARLEEQKVVLLASRRRLVRWIGGVAAAALLLLAVGLALAPAAGPDRAGTETVLHELDQLDAEQLEELLEIMPVTASALPPESSPLSELDTIKLERLLRSLEG